MPTATKRRKRGTGTISATRSGSFVAVPPASLGVKRQTFRSRREAAEWLSHQMDGRKAQPMKRQQRAPQRTDAASFFPRVVSMHMGDDGRVRVQLNNGWSCVVEG